MAIWTWVAEKGRIALEGHPVEKFPEHDCLWTVVLIENNPVGVTCQICDESFILSKESDPPAMPMTVGSVFRVPGPQGDDMHITVENLTYHSERYGGTHLEVSFRVLPDDLPF